MFHLLLYLLLVSFFYFSPCPAASMNLGVSYGQGGDDLPSPARSARLIRALGAGAVKIYDADPAVLRALSGTRLAVSIMVHNEDITSIAADYSLADAWVRTNLLPFLPRVRVRYLLVGNEILSDHTNNARWLALVPAMLNIHRALRANSVRNVKVGTPHAMDVLQSSFPPSAGAFRANIAESVMKPLLHFLNGTRGHFFVDAYPYFAWAATPSTIDLAYALFEGNSSTHYKDPASGLTYTNLLDQQLDAVVAAMAKLGYGNVELGIAETGWPHAGDYDQIGANVHNAATYNRNLARRMADRVGTPVRPGVAMPAFVFALYDEDRKPGPGTERHWGLLYPNETAVYALDLSGRRTSYPPLPPPTNNEPYEGKIWCVVRRGEVNATALGAALSQACGQGKGTCDAIQRGRECYEPDTLAAHASYAFNAYWQQFRKSGGTCFIGGLAVQTLADPSHGPCKFPSSTD